MIPLDPPVRLASREEDGLILLAVKAMAEGRHTVAQIEATVPGRKEPTVTYDVVTVTERADLMRFGHKVYPRAQAGRTPGRTA
jgi:hypothetical protein